MNEIEPKLMRLYHNYKRTKPGTEEWNKAFEEACSFVESKRLYNAWGARKKNINEYEKEIGRIALWHALDTYDDKKGTKLSTWIITKIRYAFLQQRDYDNAQKFAVKISKRAYYDWKRIGKKIDEWKYTHDDEHFDVVEDLGETRKSYEKYRQIDMFLNDHIADISDYSPASDDIEGVRTYTDETGQIVIECGPDGLNEDDIIESMHEYISKLSENAG